MPKVVKFPKSKQEKAKEKEAAKVMICRGETSADVARALKINHGTLRNWISDEGWRAEISQAQELMRPALQNPTIAQRVAFDMGQTKKETRASFARTSLKIAQWAEQEAQSTPEVLFEMGSQYKAHVESAAKVAGDWEDSSANRFAVAIQVNGIDAGIRKVPTGVTVVEE